MEPEDFDDVELDTEADDWDEDTLNLDWEEADAQSVARELGIVTSEL
jgi:hypothetical protein